MSLDEFKRIKKHLKVYIDSSEAGFESELKLSESDSDLLHLDYIKSSAKGSQRSLFSKMMSSQDFKMSEHLSINSSS